jgi:RNA polymerase sigma factor (sigma-70 family)
MSATEHPSSHDVNNLYRQHHSWLQGWLRKRINCSFDAADLAHDTFVRIISARHVTAIQQPREYLATIAKGLLIDRFRHRAVEHAFLETLANLPEPTTISAEEHAIIVETLVAIVEAFDKLDKRTRDVFILAQFDALTYAQIGDRLGISVTTVKKHFARALTMCLQLATD